MRDKLYNIANKNNLPNDWRNYRRQRNICNKLHKQYKSNYYFKKLNKLKNDDINDCDDDSNCDDGPNNEPFG